MGDYFYVNPGQNFAEGETLVHIEACSAPSVGNGAGLCPFSFAAGDYTFYGRYNAVAVQDQREPLATTFAARFVNGGGSTVARLHRLARLEDPSDGCQRHATPAPAPRRGSR